MRRVVETRSPNYHPFEGAKLHASIMHMLGIKDALQVHGVSNATIKTKLNDTDWGQSPGRRNPRFQPLTLSSYQIVCTHGSQPVKIFFAIIKPAPLD